MRIPQAVRRHRRTSIEEKMAQRVKHRNIRRRCDMTGDPVPAEAQLYSKEEAEVMVRRLAYAFHITPPKVRWTARMTRTCGRAYLPHPKKPHGEIVMGPNSPAVQTGRAYAEDTILHEFAHILVAARYQAEHRGDPGFRDGLYPSEYRGHNDRFCKTLQKIVDFWYNGETWRFNWFDDYPTVAAWAYRRGLTRPQNMPVAAKVSSGATNGG